MAHGSLLLFLVEWMTRCYDHPKTTSSYDYQLRRRVTTTFHDPKLTPLLVKATNGLLACCSRFPDLSVPIWEVIAKTGVARKVPAVLTELQQYGSRPGDLRIRLPPAALSLIHQGLSAAVKRMKVTTQAEVRSMIQKIDALLPRCGTAEDRKRLRRVKFLFASTKAEFDVLTSPEFGFTDKDLASFSSIVANQHRPMVFPFRLSPSQAAERIQILAQCGFHFFAAQSWELQGGLDPIAPLISIWRSQNIPEADLVRAYGVSLTNLMKKISDTSWTAPKAVDLTVDNLMHYGYRKWASDLVSAIVKPKGNGIEYRNSSSRMPFLNWAKTKLEHWGRPVSEFRAISASFSAGISARGGSNWKTRTRSEVSRMETTYRPKNPPPIAGVVQTTNAPAQPPQVIPVPPRASRRQPIRPVRRVAVAPAAAAPRQPTVIIIDD